MSDRPGPQPWNLDVAPTFLEQLAKIHRPRPARPYPATVADRLAATIAEYGDVVRPAVLDLIAVDVARWLATRGAKP